MELIKKISQTRDEFMFNHVTVEETYATIFKLSNSSCFDVFNINSKFLKIAASYICEPLTHIYNYCLDNETYPESFKMVKVIPIYKKGSKSSYNNYRPISIISTISKIFEILINSQIINYFESNYLFTSSQYGFRANSSTIKALTIFIKKCFDGVENGNFVSGRFYDMTKAFDTISHNILLKN